MNKIKVLYFLDNDGPSKLQEEIIKELQKEFKNVIFLKVDINDSEVLNVYNVKEFPTLIIENDGSPKIKFSGLTQMLFIKRALNELIK
ncbi:MAG: thioredoxin family protein [Candidatus Aenigmarchaeota archaeon]|nr:thioredoxin family protein [Candidatus Aenigmarchaeota archaeon]MBU5688661.1 thioredoxin family protein [Candidatus Aenigmarchaeota archaeon]